VISFSEALAFCVVGALALTLVSYMLYRRAAEMDHPRRFVLVRLSFLWLGCTGIVGIGVYLRRLYPAGLFDVNLPRFSPDQPLITSGGSDAIWPLLLGAGGMAACALLAWWGVTPLQRPPAGEKQ